MIIEILKHTPQWVFALLIFLIVMGFMQSKNRTVKRLLILPLPTSMVFLSIFGIYSSFGLALLSAGVWFISLVVILYLVIEYFPVKGVIFNSTTNSFFIPGSWLPFILMMAIFFTKYIVDVLSVIYPSFVANNIFVISCSLIYGMFSGAFLARAISMWRVIRS